MKEIVLFSGGLDSAYLVYNLLKEGKTNLVLVHCQPHYIDQKKLKLEKIAIDKLIKFYKNEFENCNIRLEYIKTDIETKLNGYDLKEYSIIRGYPQPIAWLFNVLFLAGGQESNVYIGFNGNDDMVNFKKDFDKVVNSVNKFFKNKIELKMPLMNKSKNEIIYECISKGMFELSHWCETPEYNDKNCNHCNCCEEVGGKLISIANKYGDQKIKNYAKKWLIENMLTKESDEIDFTIEVKNEN